MGTLIRYLIASILILPFVTFSQIQVGSSIQGSASNNFFGRSVVLSDDGSKMAIGGEGYNSFAGVARVYENIGGTWTQIGSDIVGNASNDQLGTGLALSGDGNVLAVGAPNGSSYLGYVKIYENQGGAWVQLASIDGLDADALLGNSVDLSIDGTVIAVGAYNYSSGRGFVRVYENIGGNWSQVGSDLYGDNVGDQFGYIVSLSADGSKVAVSARSYNSSRGQVKVFEFQSTDWVQLGNDIVGEGSNDQSAIINLSGSGSILAIGGPNHNGSSGLDTGHVKIFEYQGGSWIQIGSEIEGEASGDKLGTSVSLSSNGSILAVGSIYYNSLTGYTKIYQNISGVWTSIGSAITGEYNNNQSGTSLSLSSDGSLIAIGEVGGNSNGSFTGQARVFDISGELSTEQFVKSKTKLYPNPVNNKFNVVLSEGIKLLELNIYNGLGQHLISTNELLVDTTNLPKGFYNVEIKTDFGSVVKKIIIN